jgi:hypothetical protein
MYLNRSRIDLLGGGLISAIRRAILLGRMREGLRKNLQQVAIKLEASCGSRLAQSRCAH